MPTVDSYNIVLTLCARLGDPRAWRLFQQMKTEHVDANETTYSVLISFFSKSNDRQDLERADFLLQSMERRTNTNVETNSSSSLIWPCANQFHDVLVGWLQVGDMDRAARVLERRISSYLVNENERAQFHCSTDIDLIARAWIQAGELHRATAFLKKIARLQNGGHLPKGAVSSETLRLLREALEDSYSHPSKSKLVAQVEELLDQHYHVGESNHRGPACDNYEQDSSVHFYKRN